MSDYAHKALEKPPMEYVTVTFICSGRRSVDMVRNDVRRMEYCPMCGDEITDVEVDRL